MTSLKSIRNRKKSIQSTQKIISAMKVVSASKLKRAQSAALDSRPYMVELKEMLDLTVREYGLFVEDFPDIIKGIQSIPHQLIIVITSDRGLCGAFNSSLLKEAMALVQKCHSGTSQILCIGKKGYDFFKSRSVNILGHMEGLTHNLHPGRFSDIVTKIVAAIKEEKIGSCYLVHARFKSIMEQKIISKSLIPLEGFSEKFSEKFPEGGSSISLGKGAGKVSKEGASDASEGLFGEYLFEPKTSLILESMFHHYLKAQIYQGFLETYASEHAARMVAMDSANRNASEVIKSLELYYNKTRQAYITRELIEIISGMEAI